MAAPHHPGHAGSRRVGSAAFKRRKKLSLAACASACLKCAICSPACYGTANTVCNTPSTGPTGGAPTNSWPSSTTTENANIPCLIAFDCSCLIDIYNCSTRPRDPSWLRRPRPIGSCTHPAGYIHDFADEVEAGNLFALHGLCVEFRGVDAACGYLGLGVALGSGGIHAPGVNLLLHGGQRGVCPV